MDIQIDFLSLLFNEEEEICLSPNKYGYKSIPFSEIKKGPFLLIPNTEKMSPLYCSLSEIRLVAINPIKGEKKDANVTSYRNFLIEIDSLSIEDQIEYVKKSKMPVSAAVYSGSKSIHFIVCLNENLPSEEIWRYYNNWILNVLAEADQQVRTPTKSVRFPGSIRPETGKEQRIVTLGKRFSLDALKNWLSEYHSLRPVPKEKPVRLTDIPVSIEELPQWVQNELIDRIDITKGRNNRWFQIGFICGLQGWDESDTISVLESFFFEERDFKKKEWETAVRSGVKKASNIDKGE